MTKDPAPSDLADKFMLRMPDGMRDRLKREAADNNRSLNAEIVARLEKSFEANDLLLRADHVITSQERYMKALEDMNELQKATAKVLGALIMDPKKAEEFKRDQPAQLKRLIEVAGRGGEPEDKAPEREKRKRRLNLDDPPTD